MAAGQVLCSFFPVVFEKLNGLIKEGHLGPFWSVEEELNNVFMDFCKIKDVLTDAEQKQLMAGGAAVQFWLKRLNEAAYEADDVLDELQVKALNSASQEIGASVPKKRRKDGCEDIKKLSKKFRKIAKEIKEHNLQKGNVEKRMEEICPGRETSPLATEQHPYGRDEDKKELLERLLKDDYKSLHLSPTGHHPSGQTKRSLRCSAIEDISICSIVGIGGIGKTTLAQMVYNDARVAKYFASRFWVCVSNVFDAERIVKEIVPSSDSLEDGLKKLSSTRFLLVLDDVWEEKQEKWNKFKAFFGAGVGEGSSIIVTTRLQTVADITSTVDPLCIQVLSKTHCWDLFKKYAFGRGNEEKPALVKIGKEIVDKCGGLPLAVKALASLLRHKKEENEWLSIKDSAIWELPPSDENNILPALMLSYSHLPPLLKQCFVYCSIFPQDYKIEKYYLIQQWMAHSLVQPEAGKELEDVGNKIFNALLRLSFFQDAEKDEYGDIISFKMHDRMHDLARYIAGDEYSVGDIGGEKMSREICKITRHVSLMIGCRVSMHSILESIQSQGLRSLIIDGGRRFSFMQELEFSCQYLHRLRALDLNYSGILVLPDCFDEMIHLRYIDLSNTHIKFLPKSICCLLRNLQTLKLQGCYQLEALPNDMSKMRSLRHLHNKGCYGLQRMPVGIGQLSSLRTLNCFIVGSESGYDGVTELRGLDLGGELEIKGLEHVISSTEAKAANLVEKKKIRSLDLHWSFMEELTDCEGSETEDEDEDSQQPQQQHQEVIDGLQPHANLRTLLVQGYQGPNSPSWLTPSCVPNLVKISLLSCRKCERLSPLGKLGSLKILFLKNMDSWKFIVMDDDARTFPSLEELRLERMPNLEGWSSSSLMQSTLSSSSQAAIAPVFPRLKRVRVSGCPKLEGEVPLSGSPVEHVSIDGSSNGMVLGSLHDLPYLPSLEIRGHAEMENLPPVALRNLTSLQVLKIQDCDNLKTLPVQLKSLTTLTQLSIGYCGNLVSLAEGEGGLRNLSSLKTLHIDDCNALKHLPQFHKTSLVDLAISNCPQMEFSTDDFEHLVVLKLSRLPKLTCFPKGGPRNLSSLKTLHIDDCNALKHLPQFHMTSLVDLAIRNCPQMEFSTDDFEHLVVLETLTLHRLPKLTFFLEGIKHTAETLRRLDFQPCSENGAMDLPDWISTLTSLQDLSISVPKNWKMLPQWLQDFTALRYLFIYGCDEELERRWNNRDKQRDDNCFNMISHVSFVEISSNVWSDGY